MPSDSTAQVWLAPAASPTALLTPLTMTGVDRVVVVLGHDADEIRARIDFGSADVVICSEWARGQGFSLRRGVAALAGADAVVITLADQPFITPQVISGALDQLEGYDAVRAVYDGTPGHPVVLGPRVLGAVGELEGDAGDWVVVVSSCCCCCWAAVGSGKARANEAARAAAAAPESRRFMGRILAGGTAA